MKERPILFSGAMVRALLAGTKTQTRRVVKPLPITLNRDTNSLEVDDENIANGRFAKQVPCPYGQTGDRLWVRETWAYGIHAMAAKRDENGPFVYAAEGTTQGRLCDRWRPSIYMPRWASRITLEITDVRVERLQDISPDDCIAEGAWPIAHRELGRGHEAVATYQTLWESINGPGSWDANPWVWVVEFRRIEAEGGAA